MQPNRIPARHEKDLNVIVETPRGSRTKYTYDPKTSSFLAKRFLPYGMAFPANFGFVPSTKAEDGDPLDALIVMEEPSHPGCLIRCRVLGVIEAEQAEDGERFRNDRLIVAPVVEGKHAEPRSLADLSPGFIEEVERFFLAYNRTAGREIKILGHHGPQRAENLIRAAMRKK